MFTTPLNLTSRFGTLGAIGAACLAAPAGAALTLSFAGQPTDSSLTTGASHFQISAEVTDVGHGDACISFSNSGPKPLFLSGVFLMGDPMLKLLSLDGSTPFQQDGIAQSFPFGGTTGSASGVFASFSPVTLSGAADTASGIGPGGDLKFCFSLINGNSFSNLVNALNSGSLRIGVRTGFADGSPSFLSVISPACKADSDGNGAVKVTDFLDYLQFYQAGSPVADLNDDSSVNVQDFLSFLNMFAAGCPAHP